ncbi:MAG: prolyl oligopeptidase family serine peptidase [Trinickia sp.]|uniref:prolyl oligopeptidase family serine peptidase n=1 Tax=Trinickia sp. TaxID=2571163 RepID=UPI003F822300
MRIDPARFGDGNEPIKAGEPRNPARQTPRPAFSGPPGMPSFPRPSDRSGADANAGTASAPLGAAYVLDHLARLMRDGRTFYVGDRALTLGPRGTPRIGAEELSVDEDGALTLSGRTVALRDTPAARRDESAHFALHGHIVDDPYRWMNEVNEAGAVDASSNAELVGWMQAQNGYTRAKLDASPARPQLERDMRDAAAQAAAIPENVVWRDGRQFYWRTPTGEGRQKLFMRTGLDGDERLVFDPETNRVGGERRGTFYSPWGLKSSVSPDGKYVAVPLSYGNEVLELAVVETATGSILERSLPDISNGSIAWLDDSMFVYQRCAPCDEDLARTDRYGNKRIFRHVVGTDMQDDVPVFGNGVQADATVGPMDNLDIRIIGDHAFGTARYGVSHEQTVFTTPKEDLLRGAPSWKKIIDSSRGVVDFDKHGDEWLLMVRGSAQRERRILRAQGTIEPDWGTATLAVPETGQDITGMYLINETLHVTRMANAMTEELLRVPLDDGEPGVIFSIDGKISSVSGLPAIFGDAAEAGAGHDDVFVEAVPWTSGRPQSWRVTHEGRAAPIPSLSATSGPSPDIAVDLLYAPNPGGRTVPVIVIHRKDLSRDDRHIAKLVSYGGYEVRAAPTFFFHELDVHGLVERRNVVLAYADVWDGAADEVNAAAKKLIEEGYTSEAQLTRSGRSRGGATVGLAGVEDPNLSGKLLLEYPMVDTFGHELTANGPGNVPELGTVSTREGFEGKLKFDVYRNLPGVHAAGNIMVTTAYMDNRVEAAGAAKLVAALQHEDVERGRQRDVFLRSDSESGHFPLTVEQRVSYATDIGLFVLGAY